MKPLELVAMVERDLGQLEQAIRWAHADAYWPTNADPVRANGPTTDDQEPDHVPGPRHDIGIGNHRRRQALRAAIGKLREAELHLSVAAAMVGHWQPRALQQGPLTTARALVAIRRARRRCVALSRPDGPTVDRLPQTKRALSIAADCTDKACRILDAAFSEGEAGSTPTAQVATCRICGIRPAAPRDQRTGGRCHTCKTWRTRNGFERPRNLDTDGIAGARAAQARRTARGEGWGEA